ncbi:glycolate oxidase, subunit glcd [Heliomicrobium modesticaldum Ice1]|uniref:Glycolate oxidase, subunit glcd n=1 Tax=Heliobacterium modesticaldum (strain ATCC 51547 / Ice1) TaxID=498761 RepID=B0TF00_HELMI|nr:FAD-linked oxidase C-terminal domain-containing protein [Heliomicrobium modesticaldum]ABZ82983.1 glycolate oxidase, subunit glcd [Heliomicrobium modesticaldum Ice1]
MSVQQAIREVEALLGKERLLTAVEDLACYSFDGTADAPSKRPDAVIMPETTEEVQAIMRIASKYKIPVYPRGAGTNLSGGTIPIKGGLVVTFQRMNKILEIDAENLTATVQPGVIIASLNAAVAPYGLIYPPDPGTVSTATMAGSTAECSGGLRGLKYGVTKHYIMGLEVVLANGEKFRAGGKTVKNVTAYDLVKLFTGSEGTLGIITELIVKLIPAPETKKSMLAIFSDLDDAGKTIAGIIAAKVIPATLEIMDKTTIETVEAFAKAGLPTDAEAVLLIEVDGIAEVVEKEAQAVVEVCKRFNGKVQVARDDAEREKLWAARRAALPALARKSPTTVLEDATVPRSRIPEMLRAIRAIAKKYDLLIGTFGHAGDGNLHPTILCDERNAEQMKRVHKAVDEIFRVAVDMGGTLSGEHGIGMAKMKYLEWELGATGVDVLRRIKEALDPDYLLNPGKMVAGRS